MSQNRCCVSGVTLEAVPQVGCVGCIAWPQESDMCRALPDCCSRTRDDHQAIIWRPATLENVSAPKKEEIMNETAKKETKPSDYSATVQIHEGPVTLVVSERVSLSIQTARPPIITVSGQEITIQG